MLMTDFSHKRAVMSQSDVFTVPSQLNTIYSFFHWKLKHMKQKVYSAIIIMWCQLKIMIFIPHSIEVMHPNTNAFSTLLRYCVCGDVYYRTYVCY